MHEKITDRSWKKDAHQLSYTVPDFLLFILTFCGYVLVRLFSRGRSRFDLGQSCVSYRQPHSDLKSHSSVAVDLCFAQITFPKMCYWSMQPLEYLRTTTRWPKTISSWCHNSNASLFINNRPRLAELDKIDLAKTLVFLADLYSCK